MSAAVKQSPRHFWEFTTASLQQWRRVVFFPKKRSPLSIVLLECVERIQGGFSTVVRLIFSECRKQLRQRRWSLISILSRFFIPRSRCAQFRRIQPTQNFGRHHPPRTWACFWTRICGVLILLYVLIHFPGLIPNTQLMTPPRTQVPHNQDNGRLHLVRMSIAIDALRSRPTSPSSQWDPSDGKQWWACW